METGERTLVTKEVIDLCDSSEESQSAAKEEEDDAVEPAVRKKARTNASPPSATTQIDEKPSLLLSKLGRIIEGEAGGGLTQEEDDADVKTPLRIFLEASILATDLDLELLR